MKWVWSLNNTCVALALFITPAPSLAGEWSDKCEQAGKKSKAACDAAANSAKAADNAQAAGNIAGVGSSSTVNPAAGAMKKQAQDQQNRLNGAKNKCEEEKKNCEQECDQEENKRKQEANKDPKLPRTQQAKADEGPLKEKKQSACIVPLLAVIGDLGSGAAQAGQAAQQAGNTGGSSGGMPMPLPIPLGGGNDKKDTPSQATNPTPDKLNCETEGNSRYSDCNSAYIEKCQNSITAAGCEPFINRYCGNTSTTPTQTNTPATTGNDNLSLSTQSTSVTANLVADKQGEGLGSDFCKKVTATKFCAMAGRAECPSCKNLNSAWPVASSSNSLAAAQSTCPTDPMFLDPAVQAQVNVGTSTPSTANTMSSVSTQSIGSKPVGAAGGSAGGSGSMHDGGAGGAGSVGGAPGGAARDASSSGSSFGGGDFGAGGGGGGGGSSYQGDASGPGYNPASVNGQAQRAPAAVAGQAVARDVANQYGPSVFSIQSTTYRDMCARGRFLHCRR